MNLAKQLKNIEIDLSEMKSILKHLSNPNSQKEILTAQETIDMLQISRSNFDKLRSYGFLKCYKLNRRIYCKRSEVLEALENGLIEQKKQ